MNVRGLKRCRLKTKTWSLKSSFNSVFFLEHEIFEQNLKHLNLRTHNFFWTRKVEKQETQKKIINKLKLSHKNEKEISISSERKKIFKPYNWNEV